MLVVPEKPCFSGTTIYSAFVDWGYSWTDSFWMDIKKLMAVFKKLSEEKDFRLKVALFPTVFQVVPEFENNIPQKHFEAIMNELEIPHLDLLPTLRDKYKKDRVNIYYDHCHMTPEGNFYAGKAIAEFLAREMTGSNNG